MPLHEIEHRLRRKNVALGRRRFDPVVSIKGILRLVMETLGKRIAKLRREKGLKQDQLAEKLSVSLQAVSKWENDQTCPDIGLLPELG